MDYSKLKALFCKHESSKPATHLTAYITFSFFGQENTREYPWEVRTYVVSSNNKAFQPNMGGYSIFGSCLDGTDQHIRLENFMREERGAQNGWVVEEQYGFHNFSGSSSDWCRYSCPQQADP